MKVCVRALLAINPWAAAALGFVLLCGAVTDQSIDMDEAQTWDYARLGSLTEFWSELRSDPASESQMPLGMLAWWGWGRLWGTGELAMRTLNLVWAAAALASLAAVGKKLGMGWLPLLFAIQPYVWYAMDHARTPVMQVAAGALLMLGVVKSLPERTVSAVTVLTLTLGAILLCGSSMLGLLPTVAVFTGLAIQKMWTRVHLGRASKAIFFAGTTLLGILGIYYGLTLLRGAGGAKIWDVSPANAAYVLYEFLGFQGLGPGRQDLRDMMRGFIPASGILPFLPLLCALAVGYILLVVSAVKGSLTRPFPRFHDHPVPLVHAWSMGMGVCIQSLLMLFLLAAVVGFPFWGRHLAGAFPFWVLGLAITWRWAGQGLWQKVGRAGIVLTVFMLVLSSALLRFAPFHKHDDYRSAARSAQRFAADGGSVWWVADHSGGAYYGIEFLESPEPLPGQISFAPNSPSAPQNPPDIIILSRPDNFDRAGTATRMTKESGYRLIDEFRAFQIWEIKP